jgi:hypothetical protein
VIVSQDHDNAQTGKHQQVRKQNNFQQSDIFLKRAHEQLANSALRVETYAFEYPSVRQDLPPHFAHLDTDELTAVESAGIHYADDFTLHEPLDLCLHTGIASEKISALYSWAEVMIHKIHVKEEKIVSSIREIREARKRVRADSDI